MRDLRAWGCGVNRINIMRERDIFSLKQPAKNRDVKFEADYENSIVILDGISFESITDAEDYLETKPRLDVP